MKLEIIQGDCMDVMRNYPNGYFDWGIIDPPYGIGESGGKSESRCKATGVKPNSFKKKNWDKEPPSVEYFRELKRVTKNQIIWGANHFIQNIPNANSSCWIVWDKVNGENDFADCELAYSSLSSAVRKVRYKWHGMIQADMKYKEKRIHPTQKPIGLYSWIYENYVSKGARVLDTHLGSGSNAIAAHYFGVGEFVGVELDKGYYNAACKRIKEQTTQLKLKL